jgi:hypothetical protein
MTLSALYSAPVIVVAGAVMLGVLVCLELGHLLGKAAPVGEKQFSAISSSILALVGLLLAFSFSLAADRQSQRRAAVVQEANSVGTFWLRTSLLPGPVRAEARAMTRRYVDVHFEHIEAGMDQARATKLEAEAIHLQEELWALLMEEAHRSPGALSLLLVTPALNAMIDDTATVLAARENRLPDSILLFLFTLVALASVIIGYGTRAERRNWVFWGAFALVLGSVLLILVDMDRPRQGLIRVGIDPYLRLRASMQAD